MKSLGEVIKYIRALIIAVPEWPEAWNLFFDLLENAFEIRKVKIEMEVCIFVKKFREGFMKSWTYIKREDIKNYKTVKAIELREFQQIPDMLW